MKNFIHILVPVLIAVALVAASFSDCSNESENNTKQFFSEVDPTYIDTVVSSVMFRDGYKRDIFKYTIDSCEYIGKMPHLTHRGQCKFCKARRLKEWQEFISQPPVFH